MSDCCRHSERSFPATHEALLKRDRLVEESRLSDNRDVTAALSLRLLTVRSDGSGRSETAAFAVAVALRVSNSIS